MNQITRDKSVAQGAVRTHYFLNTREFGYGVALGCLLLSLLLLPFELVWLPPLLLIGCTIGLAIAFLPAVLVLAMPVYALGGMVFSNTLIESGSYITEQFRYGHQVGATSMLACWSIAFLVLSHYSIVRVARPFWGCATASWIQRPTIRRLIIAALLVIACALAAIVILYGGASAVGGDRFNYWRTLPPELNLTIVALRTYLLPAAAALAGFYLANTRSRDFRLILALISPYVALFFMGERTSAFIAGAASVLFGLGLGIISSGRGIQFSVRGLVYTLVLLLAIFATTFIGFDRTSDLAPLEAISQRLVLQGHVWYGIYESDALIGSVSFWDLASPNSMDSPSGLNLLSYLVTSPEYVHTRLTYGLTFTMGGPPAHLAAFGVGIGAVTFIASGLLYALITKLFLMFVQAEMLVSSGIALLSIPIVTNIVLMGFWDDAYSIVTIAILCWVLGAILTLIARSAGTSRRTTKLLRS